MWSTLQRGFNDLGGSRSALPLAGVTCPSTTEKLGIKPRKRGFAGGWWWEINPAAQDAHTQNVGILGGEGHLGAPSDAGMVSTIEDSLVDVGPRA